MRKIIAVVAFMSMSVPAAFAHHDKKDPNVEVFQKRMEQFAQAWNQHDAKAMAAFWSANGDVLNPMGRWATGPAEIEKLFNEEHTMMMKDTKFTVTMEHARLLAKGTLAVVDGTVMVTGMRKPDGTLMDMPHHMTLVMEKKGKEWMALSVRPFVLVPPPVAAHVSR